MARPKAPLDPLVVQRMAEKHWSIEEIAGTLGVNRTTIRRRFGAKMEEWRASGRAKLRDLQWKKALDGDTRMILHMSKHMLSQHEKLEQTITSNNSTQLTVQPSQALTELITNLTNDKW